MAQIINPKANKASILAKIKAEAIKYPDKTPVEIAYALNVARPDENGFPNVRPLIAEILVGEPYAPNVVDEEDILEALA